MYQRFSAFVAQQGETIQRIDANSARPVMRPGCAQPPPIMAPTAARVPCAAAEEAAVNVQEAHTQIQRYYKSVLSNRGLILKTFGVVCFLVVLFGTIVPR